MTIQTKKQYSPISPRALKAIKSLMIKNENLKRMKEIDEMIVIEEAKPATPAETPGYLPWIAAGVAGIAVVGTIVYVMRAPK